MSGGAEVVESSDDYNACPGEKGTFLHSCIHHLLAGKLATLPEGQRETEEGGAPFQIGDDSISESSSESESDNGEPKPEKTNDEPGESSPEEASAQGKREARHLPSCFL